MLELEGLVKKLYYTYYCSEIIGAMIQKWDLEKIICNDMQEWLVNMLMIIEVYYWWMGKNPKKKRRSRERERERQLNLNLNLGSCKWMEMWYNWHNCVHRKY